MRCASASSAGFPSTRSSSTTIVSAARTTVPSRGASAAPSRSRPQSRPRAAAGDPAARRLVDDRRASPRTRDRWRRAARAVSATRRPGGASSRSTIASTRRGALPGASDTIRMFDARRAANCRAADMSRLRLPRLPRTERAPLPPELRWDAPPATVALLLGRREFLKALGVAPGRARRARSVRVERAASRRRRAASSRSRERATLEALRRPHPPARRRHARRARRSASPATSSSCSPRSTRSRSRSSSPAGRSAAATRSPTPTTGTPSTTPAAERLQAVHPADAPAGAVLARRALRHRGRARAGRARRAARRPEDRAPRRLPRRRSRRSTRSRTATKGGAFAALSAADQDARARDARRRRLRARSAPRRPRRSSTSSIRHTLEGCFARARVRRQRDARRLAAGRPRGRQPAARLLDLLDATTTRYVERADHPMSTPNPDELGRRRRAAEAAVGRRAGHAERRSSQLAASSSATRC